MDSGTVWPFVRVLQVWRQCWASTADDCHSAELGKEDGWEQTRGKGISDQGLGFHGGKSLQRLP